MSLAIALAAIDGLVLAADSRVTEGYTLNGPRSRDDSVKFVQLNHAWGALTYGNAEIGNTGIHLLKQEAARDEKRFNSLPAILGRSREVFEATSVDWGNRNPGIVRHAKDVGFILAGYDRDTDSFRAFSMQSLEFTPKSPPSGCLIAGQWHIAKYFLSRLYSREMKVEELRRLAVILLNTTMAVDPLVGGSIRLATITRSSPFRWVPENEIEALNRKYEFFNGRFREHCRSTLMKLVDNNRCTNETGDIKSVG